MLLLIDKAKGLTSHDVVNKVRNITGERRVGHAGTLDPNASGLLIVGVGRESTKSLGMISKNTKKEYIADVFLGEERNTDDSEGEITKTNYDLVVSAKEIEKVVQEFIGEQEQIPPSFSAIKQSGKKAYELARKGKEVTMTPRKIIVYEAEILSFAYPIVRIRFLVSSGTYIRGLARDIGRKLGSFGYLKELRRTKIGEYSIEKAQKLEHIKPD